MGYINNFKNHLHLKKVNVLKNFKNIYKKTVYVIYNYVFNIIILNYYFLFNVYLIYI